jgi:hypothetical protein
MITDNAGKATGPFEYAVPEKSAFMLQQLKARLVASLPTAIHCALVSDTIPVPLVIQTYPAGDTDPSHQEGFIKEMAKTTARGKEIDIQDDLDKMGYPKVTAAPIVICAPYQSVMAVRDSNGNGTLIGWAAVKEVRLGFQSGVLDQTIPTTMSWEDFLKNITNLQAIEPSRGGPSFWQALLPPDTKSIYVKFIFRDGSESEEVHYPVEALRRN